MVHESPDYNASLFIHIDDVNRVDYCGPALCWKNKTKTKRFVLQEAESTKGIANLLRFFMRPVSQAQPCVKLKYFEVEQNHNDRRYYYINKLSLSLHDMT